MRLSSIVASHPASADVMFVEDDEMDADLSRAVAASMAEANLSAARSVTPPSPTNSVVCLDVDDDECQVIDQSSSSSSSSSASSSVAFLPLSPSRWGFLPIELLALISTFQFRRNQPAAELSHGIDLSKSARHARLVASPMHGVPQVASWPAWQQQNVAGDSGQPDASVLSVRQLFTMSAVCRHWQRTINPPVPQSSQSLKPGCRVVDCWSGVQQMEMKQSGKHILIGGVAVKAKRVGTVLASLTRIHSLCLEFNIDLSVVCDSDFNLLMPGSTVATFYPQLEQLTVRLIQCYVPQQPRPRRGRKRASQPYRVPQVVLYTKLSSWLDCHPKLRSFTLIDQHATLPLPHFPIGWPQPQLLARAGLGVVHAGNVAVNLLGPPQVALPPLPRPGMLPNLLLRMGPAPPQPYRYPALPQPSAAALRLLCTGRLPHLALGGETLLKLAYGEEEQKEQKNNDLPPPCFEAQDVQSIALLGDWMQPRYFDALSHALPSLTHLSLSRSQSPTGLDQILAEIGHRVKFVRGSVSSFHNLALSATYTSCSALQSLYIHVHHIHTELAQVYAALASLPHLTQLSVVEEQPPGGRYPVLAHLPELLLPPLPQLLYLHLQLSSCRVFEPVGNRSGPPSAILPAQLNHLLLSLPGNHLVPHLSSVPVLCPRLTRCHINSGESVTSQTWERRLGRLKARLRGVWCESESGVTRHRMDVAWRAEMNVRVGAEEEWEGSTF